MIQKVHSSVLLIGLHFNQNIDMGVDWAPNLEEGEQRLQKANYSVIAFSGRQNELSQLNNFVKLLRQQTPEAKIIIFNESLKWNDLCQVINSCQPFALINESKSEISHLELWLRRALEEYHQAQQDRDLSQLILRQNQQLKRTKNQLKSKLRKQRRYLTSAHEKLNQTNIHAQALQTALLTIHRAKSLGEMENCLSIDLKEYLQLNWTKILFFSQSNLLEPKLKNHLGEIRVFRAPIFSDDSSVGDLCFARSQSLPEFSSREINFFNQIAETLSLAIDRFRAFEKARSIKAQWESTFDAIAEPLCITDHQYRILRTNQSFMKAAKKNYRQLVGTDCFFSLTGTPAPSHLDSAHFPLRWKVPEVNGIHSLIYDLHVHSIHLKSTQHPGFLILFRDLTNQLRLERQLLESAKMVELGTISSSIAHELNNPLGGMLSFLQLIQMEPLDDIQIKTDIRAMEEAARRCKSLVENLLGFARFEGMENITEFDLRQVISQSVKLLELQTRSRGIEIEFIEPTTCYLLRGRMLAIAQALRNILQNAIEAVQSRMDKEPGLRGIIRLTLEQSDLEIYLSISDNGEGISAQDTQKIFNPLYSTKTSEHNQGLGLTVAFNIISEHHGVLEIFSQPGVGTLAKISLKRPDLNTDSQVFDSKI